MKSFKFFVLAIGALLCFGLVSCSSDDDNYSPVKDGYSWELKKIKSTTVETSDDDTNRLVSEYVDNYRKVSGSVFYSYQFRNDNSYLFYVNYALPVEGKYTTDGNNIKFEDTTMTGVVDKDVIYITTNLRQRAAKALEIDVNKIMKAVIEEEYHAEPYYYEEYPDGYGK
jgi:hypothetical protein